MPDETSLLPPGPLPSIGPEFHVISPLGRVGDGLVYAARDGLTRLRLREYAPAGVSLRGRDGALGPREDRFASAWRDGLEQFLAKAQALTAIAHPGIAPVFASRPGGYLIGAPVGEPLSATLAGGLVLPPHEVQLLARDLAAALAEVHARGLAHLDVSPETVSIASGTVVLTDFAVDNRRFLPLLERQHGLVRPGYSPIELHDGTLAEPLGPRTDVYAASALLFRLVIGSDPAPWEVRWRDPSASRLDDPGGYPPAFLDSIRQGMAIEPEQRFADAGVWLAAMGPAPAPPIAPLNRDIPPPPPPGEQPPVFVPAPPPRRRTSPALPLLILAIVMLGVAVGAVYAWQQGWFAPAAAEEPSDNRIGAPPEPDRPSEPEAPGRPDIEPGGAVSGVLTRSDERSSNGRFRDSFTLAGRRGQRLELRLSSGDFDPLVEMTGPGFQASNDDDSENDTRNSRLAVTLPRDGSYTITATSYPPGATGAYLLELIEAAPEPEDDVVTIDLSLASRLAGEWHAIGDSDCEQPAVNRLVGDGLISRIGGDTYSHRILEARGDRIRTMLVDGRLAGRRFDFRLDPDGEAYEIAGERWLRC
jgi:serine/threonine protein kinase